MSGQDQLQGDSLVDILFEKGNLSTTEEETDESDATFGLVVVTNWQQHARDSTLAAAYQEFYQQVQAGLDDCFGNPTERQQPYYYLYPVQALHVTVATFVRLQTMDSLCLESKQAANDSSRLDSYCQAQVDLWQVVWQRAIALPQWPSSTLLELRVQSVRFSAAAGILLWQETSGNLAQMRTCLQTAYNATKQEMGTQLDWDTTSFSIPGIIHSTFLRYPSWVPRQSLSELQERLQSVVFPSVTISTSDLLLVWERQPYMHVPANPRHVLACYPAAT
jgi:hypothetical protein